MVPQSSNVLEKLAPPGRSRGIVVVFDIGNRRQKGPLGFVFAEKEIWFVHDVEAMEQYLLEALNVEDRCTVLVWYHDYQSFFYIMGFLSRFDGQKQRDKTSVYAREAYGYYLSKINGGKAIPDPDLPPYFCDTPLPFELMVALDPSSLHRDHLSSSSIGLLQILRTITYLHGGQFAVITGSAKTNSNNAGSVLSILEKCGCDGFSDHRPEAQAVYSHSEDVNLLIPKSWDTLKSIQSIILAKVEDGVSPKSYMIESEDDHFRFIETYKHYLSQPNNTSQELLDLLGISAPPIESPKSAYSVHAAHEQLLNEIQHQTTNTIS
ncbi:hypothetical protein PGUG_03109 [Meyerozyma guilliermondii ATCC 6260]|uniref:Uncharacterized protein n=1 Tax=Meyerozyma guilliermondii (strain ATCC 6260 / CBS 566 / DSM 6381 / JCM 1539 / NBRC 10279 / NRRL Y-324) TaxID=294746 RepID=A5DIK8_PICGU|nr:uncharacterized protein PGUG_03109 [Meyerozyma guilliermondii ATCC 6260]EDK39011.2 hypothetical protein PGUG_03109 [Meyerozyma guilliermondii ATCC 6260]